MTLDHALSPQALRFQLSISACFGKNVLVIADLELQVMTTVSPTFVEEGQSCFCRGAPVFPFPAHDVDMAARRGSTQIAQPGCTDGQRSRRVNPLQSTVTQGQGRLDAKEQL